MSRTPARLARLNHLAPIMFALAATLAACEPGRSTASLAAEEATVGTPLVMLINNPPIGSRTTVGIGDTLKLEAASATKRGRNFRWTSSNTAVARVNAQGVVIASAVGSATIAATSNTRTDRWYVDVGAAVATIALSPDSVVAAPGTTTQLTVVLAAANGSVITGRRVTFRSVNTAVATVVDGGAVKTIAAGTTSIVVAAGNISRNVLVRSAIATPPTTPPTSPPTTPPTGGALGLNASLGGRAIFPADNPWNTPIDGAAVDPNSAQIIANIGLTKSFHPDFGANWNGGPFGIPYYVVSGTQPGVSVTFDYDDESDHAPYPIPANAPIEGGASSTGDRHVIIVDRDNWKVYELFYAFPKPNGSWHAGSGAIFDLKSNALRPAGWTSADAAGLPILPGLVRYDEVSAGNIPHALRFTVSRTQRAYLPPARHWASSSTDPLRPPMGMRVRLKASVNISGYPASAQVILRALKKYGMFVADNGSDWFVTGTADARWNDNEINTLKAIKGSDFEVVKMTGIVK
ncbi:MAG: Ig-like domain-containing protein [Phycisphaerae bacterium]|nr:Ig-like domain-containing protein [Gemmatimonadaceae bacterium]